MSSMTIGGGLYQSYSHIASGKRINTAADDAAGLAIGQKLERQENGLGAAAENIQDGVGVLNVADGALDGIMDYLQRIRELGLRAMNGLNSASDRETYQMEIDQLKEGIQQQAKNTTFNEQKLLDGSMADMNLAINPDGTGMKIGMANSTLEKLGIADFNVTSGNFSLDSIDKAMDMVARQRSSIGATTNRLEYAYNYNTSASMEQLSARSRIEDLDMPKAISEKKKEELLSQYKNLMLRRQMDQESLVTRLFQ